MQPVGFFRELEPDSPRAYQGSIRDSLTLRHEYPSGLVVQYLSAGHPILDVMEGTTDVLEGAFQVLGGSSILTDGTFVWRLDLAAYVERYPIQLPDDFMTFMTENHFEVPAVPCEHLIEISLSASDFLGFRADPGTGPRRS
ncbi:hypothetical protein AB0I22_26890 [Streptomyces sp. NPDC050610]|uniref:hypothetical protein n=1 Tax=Streptomyces sp. NPDC050610 TaxID=3157097 RepID=UPI00341EF9C8